MGENAFLLTESAWARNPGGIHDLVTEEHWSGERLVAEARRRLAYLTQRGIGNSDLYLITHGGTPAFFADLFAVWAIGGTAACLNSKLTVNELETIATFTEPAAILLGPGKPAFPMQSNAPQFDMAAADADVEPIPPVAVLPEQPALILFTSGTTGDPKGVVHTFGSIQRRLENNWHNLDRTILNRTLCVLPTHFGHGLIGNCLTPLLAGHNLYLLQDQGLTGAANLGSLIDGQGISFLSSVPSFWKLVLRLSPPPKHGSLKQVSVGSAPLSAELWQAIIDWAGTTNVMNMYGITETANWAAGASARKYPPENGLVGTMWGGEAALIDPSGSFVKQGEGELLLKPPSLMRGYLKRNDLTSDAIQDGWYHTGDIGSIDDQGVIRLLGRSKTEINRAGMKILPEEIDALLERHPEVEEACAFGIPDEVSGEIVGVAVALTGNSDTTIADLRNWCSKRIRQDCVPERWFPVAEIPKTDRGKINRENVMSFCMNHAITP